jgi:hypothetical protein
MEYNNQTISLRPNNPYSNGRVLVFEDGSAELERDFPVYTGNEKDSYYTVRKSDTIDKIAWMHYRDYVEDGSKYWWIICDVNGIENPLDLSEYVGQEILIPDVLNFQLIYK